MAKRYTDTAKWADDWFVALSPKAKLFWFYICDNCDHAGIWRVSLAVPKALIGEPVDVEACRVEFGDRVKDLGTGYWQLTKFIKFQYGALSLKNPTHKSAIKIYGVHKIDASPLLAPDEPLPSPLEGPKDKDKDQDKDLSQELVVTSVILNDSSLTPTNVPAAKPPRVARPVPTGFEEFWKAYPKKVAKGAAIKAWAKAGQHLTEILAALEWQRKSEQWTKNGTQFVPNPATYLNEQRWLDENPNKKVYKDFLPGEDF